MGHWGALLVITIKITHLASMSGRDAPGTAVGSPSRSGDPTTTARPQAILPSRALDFQCGLNGCRCVCSHAVNGLASGARLLSSAVNTGQHRSIGTR